MIEEARLGSDDLETGRAPKVLVLTGGPGAGKTAVLETAGRQFCEHVGVLPEAATLLFRAGFPRQPGAASRAATQRAIYHVQRELELLAAESGKYAVVLCDRGTLDGLAYWPFREADFFAQLHTTVEAEYARYAAVIHLRAPSATDGYNHRNPLRIETAEEASAIDQRIERAWSGHPRRFTVESQPDFVHKLRSAMSLISGELPDCCPRSLHRHEPTVP